MKDQDTSGDEGHGLRPLERESLRNRVYEELRAALLGGRFAPGQRMTIRALANELGTSPTPVREALGRLHAERVLDLRPNGTAIIPVMTRTRFKQITAIRAALEGLAVEEAAERMEPQDFDALTDILEQMLDLIDRQELSRYMTLHPDFHFGIYRCAGNPLLVDMIHGLWSQCGPVLTYVEPDYIRQRSGSREHQNVMMALRKRDGAAARAAITRDILNAAEYIQSLANDRGEIYPPNAAVEPSLV